MTEKRRFIITLTSLFAIASVARAVLADPIVNVPGDFATIQDGIDAVDAGGEVIVAPGVYNETIDFGGKSLTLRSTDPTDPAVVGSTVIDGTGLGDSVVRCVSGEGADTKLYGLTVTGGNEIEGGGMRIVDSSPTVELCVFTGNSASDGGGMYCLNSSPTVKGCTFGQNTALAGAGMYNENSGAVVVDSVFIENTATRIFDLFATGGGMCNLGSAPTIVNSAFIGNRAEGGGFGGGGAMYNRDSSPMVINSTFSGNSGEFGDAGGVYSRDNSSPEVHNSILWGNGTQEIADAFGAVTTVRYSDVEGGWIGAGNIDADPMFADPVGPDADPNTFGDNDYRLSDGSPCIDAADNTAVPGGVVTDLDGNPRFVDDPAVPDTGLGAPPIVDVGAYERVAPIPIDLVVVPDDVATVQAAIDLVDPGGVVVVRPGVYHELLDTKGKALTLRGTVPTDLYVVASTIIDGSGLLGSVLTCDSFEGPDTIIDGLTLRGGTGKEILVQPEFGTRVAYGGGMYISNGSSPTIRNSIIRNNEAREILGFPPQPGFGGAMYIAGSPTISSSIFYANEAINGGALFVWAGAPVIVNSAFVANDDFAIERGDIASPTIEVINCTFNANVGGIDGGIGVTVTNSILWGNGVEIHESGTEVTHSVVAGGWPGVGNIDADPGFVDAAGFDFHLQPGSPAIDAGDNFAVPADATLDLDSTVRFWDDLGTEDTGCGVPPIVDMGAYEYRGSLCQENLGYQGPGDITLNICGDDLTVAGSSATLQLAHAPADSHVWIFLSSTRNPTPIPGTQGVLVPFPPRHVYQFQADSAGNLNLSLTGGSGTPITLYLQAVALNGSVVEFSNAVELIMGS